MIISHQKDTKNMLLELKKVKRTCTKEFKKKKPREIDLLKKKLTGFALVQTVSDDLCEFMGREKGTPISRTDVTKRINIYIKENNLQSELEGNKSIITLDEKLEKLLQTKSPENTSKGPLTFFNIQKFLSPHFTKPEQPKQPEQLEKTKQKISKPKGKLQKVNK